MPDRSGRPAMFRSMTTRRARARSTTVRSPMPPYGSSTRWSRRSGIRTSGRSRWTTAGRTFADGSVPRRVPLTVPSPGPTPPTSSCGAFVPPTVPPASSPPCAGWRSRCTTGIADPGATGSSPALPDRAPCWPGDTARCWSAPVTAPSGSAKLRVRMDGSPWSVKVPATTALHGRLSGVPTAVDDAGFREIGYRRDGLVGVVTFQFYNGAMSTEQCRRLDAALRHASAQDTRVLVLRGGDVFSNGIHLGVIEAAADSCTEAWDNIRAIDDVCGTIIGCDSQLIVSAFAGNAGAGGAMLGLGADRVLVRDGVLLNPHYRTMGLYGSEYWTYLLPRRVGDRLTRTMTTECLPIGAREAVRTGLADLVVPGHGPQFDRAVRRF